MKLTGHKTEAVYRRYAITDSAMLQEAAVKLAVLHASEAKRPSSAKVGSFRLEADGSTFKNSLLFNSELSSLPVN